MWQGAYSVAPAVAPARWVPHRLLPPPPGAGRVLVGSLTLGLLANGGGGGNGNGGRPAPAAQPLSYLVPPKKPEAPAPKADEAAAAGAAGEEGGEGPPKFEARVAEALRDAQVKLLKVGGWAPQRHAQDVHSSSALVLGCLLA